MKTILYIHANPKREEDSNSLTVGRHLVHSALRSGTSLRLVEIDAYKADIPFIDEHFLSARSKLAGGVQAEQLLTKERDSIERIHTYTDQFIAADYYVFAFPLWNFGLPPRLKAYVDTIKVARRTFRYTPQGPTGLLSGKNAIIIQSSGDVYSEGHLQGFEHGSRYLSSVLTFLGVEQIETILLEGMDTRAGERENQRARALDKAEQWVKKMTN